MTEDTTAALTQFAQFRTQAKEHEAAGRFDEAVQDLRRALETIPRSSIGLRATTTGELTALLVRLNGQREAASSITNLLTTVVGAESAHGKVTPATVRVAAASKAAVLTKEDAVAERVPVESIDDLVEAFVKDLETTFDNKDEADLHAQLKGFILAIIVNLAALNSKALSVARCFDRRGTTLLIRDKDVAVKGVALLSTLCISVNSTGDQSVFVNDWVSVYLDIINESLNPTNGNPELRLAAINALIKSTDSQTISLVILRHPQLLARILETASDSSDPLRSVCPIAISRILEPILAARNQPNLPETKRVFSDQIMGYLNATTSKHKSMGLMALAALFAASAAIGSSILMTDGVIQEILEMIDYETPAVQLSIVQMLNSACADQTCRKVIGSPDSTRILLNLWKSSKSSTKLKSAAAGTLVKVMFVDKELEKSVFADTQLADGFIAGLKTQPLEMDIVANSVEALAYLSIRGFVKEVIVNDAPLLKVLISLLKSCDDKAVQYGIASLFVNLTLVRKRLSDEEEQLMKLKEVAGEIVVKPDPLDDDARVQTRCDKVVVAGIVGPLCGVANSATSDTLAGVVAQLFLNLCGNDKRHRGRIVQDGGIKALTALTTKLVSPSANPTYLVAAQSLAKIAITTDPHLAFQPISRALDLIRPLIHLLDNDSSTLQQFEGLMALTNLASFDETVRSRIVAAKGVKAMEYLQFSENTMVRRAATEALCNMMFDESVFESYVSSAAGVDGSAGRLKMMIMLCDVEDYETRRAASGALAVLTSHPDACRLLVGDSRGLDMVIGLLFGEEEDANPELIHRGVEICKNIAAVGGALAQRLEAAGVVGLLRKCALSPIKEIQVGAVEALRNLQKAGVVVLAKPQPKIVELD